MSSDTNLKWTVLVAEDDPNHAYCIKFAFQLSAVSAEVQHVTDGDEAMHYLRGEAPYSDRRLYPYPNLFLLDLKMPRLPGLEVLAWLREQPEHRTLPVVVLTVSQELTDVRRAYQLGARSFLVKPVNMEDLKNLIREVSSLLQPGGPAAADISRLEDGA